MANELAVFQDRIRKVWHEDEWWFSVTDVVGVLTDSTNPRNYWAVLKRRLVDEGADQTVTNCHQLKMQAPDGKLRTTDAANTETLLRLIQSIPSPKAEPFKLWLAEAGNEKVQREAELTESEKRLRTKYQRQGYTERWIDRRLESIRSRNKLTNEWGTRGAKQGREFAILTDTLSVHALDVTTAEHKQIKHLPPRANLQESQTGMELAITSLADEAAYTFHQERDSQGFNALQNDCQEAGDIAGDARREIERRTGKPVVSAENYKQLQQERHRELQPGLFDQPED